MCSSVPDVKALPIGQYRESSTQRPFGTHHNNPVGHTQQIHTKYTISASALMQHQPINIWIQIHTYLLIHILLFLSIHCILTSHWCYPAASSLLKQILAQTPRPCMVHYPCLRVSISYDIVFLPGKNALAWH